jgi:hypothetical protein
MELGHGPWDSELCLREGLLQIRTFDAVYIATYLFAALVQMPYEKNNHYLVYTLSVFLGLIAVKAPNQFPLIRNAPK